MIVCHVSHSFYGSHKIPNKRIFAVVIASSCRFERIREEHPVLEFCRGRTSWPFLHVHPAAKGGVVRRPPENAGRPSKRWTGLSRILLTLNHHHLLEKCICCLHTYRPRFRPTVYYQRTSSAKTEDSCFDLQSTYRGINICITPIPPSVLSVPFLRAYASTRINKSDIALTLPPFTQHGCRC